MRPQPTMTADSEFFWKGAAEGKLLIEECAECGLLRHPPAPLCPECHSSRIEHREVSGRGHVASFIIVHHPPNPWFELPVAAGIIELEEGVAVISNISDVPLDEIEIGMPVHVFFEATEGGYGVPLFRRP